MTMEFVLQLCILHSLLIIAHCRPTVNFDITRDTNCVKYNLTEPLPERKYCGEDLSNILARICLTHNWERDSRETTTSDRIDEQCCTKQCSWNYLFDFCQCLNIAEVENMIRNERLKSTTTTTATPEASNQIQKDKPTTRKMNVTRRPAIIGIDTKHSGNYIHVNPNVNYHN